MLFCVIFFDLKRKLPEVLDMEENKSNLQLLVKRENKELMEENKELRGEIPGINKEILNMLKKMIKDLDNENKYLKRELKYHQRNIDFIKTILKCEKLDLDVKLSIISALVC